MIETLPDSRCKAERGGVLIATPYGRLWHVPIFCANCGCDGPFVTEENCTFVFWLCSKCEGNWAPLAGTLAVPDEVFFAKLHEAQIEKYRRVLELKELIEAVSDESNILSKLAKEAPGRN